MNGSCDEAAIVAQKCVSTNPNTNKVQLMAVPSSVSYGTPVIIAESSFKKFQFCCTFLFII